MNILKQLGQACIQVAKHIGAFPKTIAIAIKEEQQRGVLRELEVERLDRIRNPSKYRGKEI